MAEASVQNQSSESKDREERMLASFWKLSPEEQKTKVRLAEMLERIRTEEEQEIVELQAQGMTRTEAQKALKQEMYESRLKLQQQKSKKKPITQAIMRPAEACAYLSIGRTKLHFLSETDPTFPRKIRFSPHCIGWRKESLDTWIVDKEKGLK